MSVTKLDELSMLGRLIEFDSMSENRDTGETYSPYLQPELVSLADEPDNAIADWT